MRRRTPADPDPLGAELEATPRYTATRAKNEFGHILETALRGGTVVITKHNSPKAVLISIDGFRKLTRSLETQLNLLEEEFDSLYAGMQTPKARRAARALFKASPVALGKAAVKAARRRA
jgi:antitoxin Phd